MPQVVVAVGGDALAQEHAEVRARVRAVNIAPRLGLDHVGAHIGVDVGIHIGAGLDVGLDVAEGRAAALDEITDGLYNSIMVYI